MTSSIRLLFQCTRGYASRPTQWKKDGVKYGLVTYYPRQPDHVDPPFTPSKVLMVYRVKPFKGNPYWDKNVLKALGFDEEEKRKVPVIVKNTPEMCALLWKVKHLVKIVPVKLPEKLPELNDYTGTYLHENGTFYCNVRMDPRRYEATVNEKNSAKTMDPERLKEKLRLLWLKGTLM